MLNLLSKQIVITNSSENAVWSTKTNLCSMGRTNWTISDMNLLQVSTSLILDILFFNLEIKKNQFFKIFFPLKNYFTIIFFFLFNKCSNSSIVFFLIWIFQSLHFLSLHWGLLREILSKNKLAYDDWMGKLVLLGLICFSISICIKSSFSFPLMEEKLTVSFWKFLFLEQAFFFFF